MRAEKLSQLYDQFNLRKPLIRANLSIPKSAHSLVYILCPSGGLLARMFPRQQCVNFNISQNIFRIWYNPTKQIEPFAIETVDPDKFHPSPAANKLKSRIARYDLPGTQLLVAWNLGLPILACLSLPKLAKTCRNHQPIAWNPELPVYVCPDLPSPTINNLKSRIDHFELPWLA